jgi:hypothetical protein
MCVCRPVVLGGLLRGGKGIGQSAGRLPPLRCKLSSLGLRVWKNLVAIVLSDPDIPGWPPEVEAAPTVDKVLKLERLSAMDGDPIPRK